MREPTQRDLQAETRRTQLLDTALALFARQGVENVSVKDLAAEVGVAQGLIYYYFKSKDDLLAAVIERHNPLDGFHSVIDEITDLPVQEGLLIFAHRLAVLLDEKRLFFRLLVRELLSPRSDLLPQALPIRDIVISLLADYLQHGIARGELKPHDPQVAVHLLVSSLITLHLLGKPVAASVDPLVQTLLDGIRAP